MTQQQRAAVFIDKDGTLIEDVPFNVELKCIRLSPGAGESLRLLHEAGFMICIITNQSGVAYGYFKEEALHSVHTYLERLLGLQGVPLLGFYYCPHHPDGTVKPYARFCHCRKPQPGLLQRAASELSINLRDSWLIGDILNDIEAGNRAGCSTVLLDNGNETEWRQDNWRSPCFTAPNLLSAANMILSSGVRRSIDQQSKAIVHAK